MAYSLLGLHVNHSTVILIQIGSAEFNETVSVNDRLLMEQV